MNKTRMLGMVAVILFICACTVRADVISGSIKLSSTFFPISGSLQGSINLSANTLSVDPTAIVGAPYITLVSELLSPGTYTRVHNLSTGGTISRTGVIPVGTIGAYFVIDSNSSEHQLFMAWDISNNNETFTNHPIAGNVWIGAPYDGRTFSYSFDIVPPFSEVTMQVIGGGVFECNEQLGSTVTLDSNPATAGVAVLDRVEWVVDGVLVSQGASLSEFFDLGHHSITGTAITTAGDSASDTVSIDVIDTVGPLLEVVFIDSAGNQVISAADGDFTIQFNNSDVCDPVPVVSGSAQPVMAVNSGDVISIIQSTGDVVLPTTAVSVSARSVDSSGNTTLDSNVLLIQ